MPPSATPLPVVTVTHIHTGPDIAPLRRYSTAIPQHKQYVLQLPVDKTVSAAELCADALDYLRECRPAELPEWLTVDMLLENLSYEIQGALPSWLDVEPPPAEDIDYSTLFEDDEGDADASDAAVASNLVQFFADEDDASASDEEYEPTYAYFRIYWS